VPDRRAVERDAGIVASAEPGTYVVAPSVASAFIDASERPTSPFIVIRPDALASSRPWQQASRKMSRYEVRTTL